MKAFIGIVLLLVFTTSCQQPKKQVFNEGPEIDMVKKLDQAFAGADWDTFRASFSDTAKIWVNTSWSEPSIPADTLTQGFRTARANMSQATLNENAIYSMIDYDNGERWVHRWGVWQATYANGKSATWTSNANFRFAGGKIIRAGYIFNALPGFQANQPDPAPAK